MKIIFCGIFLLFFVGSIDAQIDIKSYYENEEDIRVLYVDNNEFCPVTLEFDLKLNNVKSSLGPKFNAVIPPRTKKYKVAALTRLDRARGASAGTGSTARLGDYRIKNYDQTFRYFLPYRKGKKFNVGQGYQGKRTHRDQNALDFDMPVGTEISAARGGVVVNIVEHNDRGCADRLCIDLSNVVVIYHSDGTFAEYAHLQKNGVLVKKGQKVVAGQVIALSGNTGFSSGPHLHLAVYIPRIGKKETLKTKFRIKKGKKDKYLKEGKSYSKKY